MNNEATILVVDDSPTIIRLLATILKDKYTVKIATTGQDCIKNACLDPKPDLILLDIEMPEMNGYEVCKQLKKNKKSMDIPVIFVTGKDAEADEEYGLNLGAVDYITKPISIAIVLARVKTHVELKQHRDKLQTIAMHDQLTGLNNRHYLLEVANHKIARAMRHAHPLSLLMMDIDHFKAINDNYGHPKGDEVLKKISTTLKEQSRGEDIVSRLGGEEFVILLDQCDITTAHKKAQEIRLSIESLNPGDIKTTVSIGVAELHPGEESFDGLLKRADIAVYKAKEKGRNCVVSV